MPKSTNKRSAEPSNDERAAERREYVALMEMNKRTAQVKLNGKVRYIDTTDREIAFYSRADMADLLAHHCFINKEGEATPVFKNWLRWSERTAYDGIVFEPDTRKPIGKALNLFRGFAVTPKGKVGGGWSRLEHHLRHNICAGNQQHFAYLMDWIACIFQRPGHKTGVALVLYGAKGTGKSIVSDIIAQCVGVDYCPVVDTPEALTGKHNSHLARAILVRVEEALHAKDPRHESRLKHMITGGRLLIEPKGIDSFEVESKCNFIFTTNKPHAVAATGGERRFFCLEVAANNQQDAAYFGALLDEMKLGGREAFVADLLKRDLSLRELSRPPETRLLSRQIVESMTGLERWWAASLAAGRLPFQRAPEAGEGDAEWPATGAWTVPCSLVVESAATWGRDYAGAPTPEGIGRFLAAAVPGIDRTRRQVLGERERVYNIPPLDVCRRAFAAQRPGLHPDDLRSAIPDRAEVAEARTGCVLTGNVVQLPRRRRSF